MNLYLLSDKILDEFAVLHFTGVGLEVLGNLGYISEHEIAAFWDHWRETDVEEQLRETVAFRLELFSDRLEIGLG